MPAGSEFQRKLREQDDRLIQTLERIARALERLVDIQEVKRAMWRSHEDERFIGIDGDHQ